MHLYIVTLFLPVFLPLKTHPCVLNPVSWYNLNVTLGSSLPQALSIGLTQLPGHTIDSILQIPGADPTAATKCHDLCICVTPMVDLHFPTNIQTHTSMPVFYFLRPAEPGKEPRTHS